ncbi:hypothetical protein TNCV_5047981 [Trichonephila clavipes]|nr:hypothetical protein TNCV_5047981 [Trichonephila clavipes]
MKRARKFKDRRKRVPDEERSGPVITDDLMQAIETKIRENRRFTISNLSLEFPDISRSVVYKTVLKTSTLRCLLHKSREAPKSIAKQTTLHAAKRWFCSSTITQGSHFSKDLGVNESFGWDFGPCTIQTRPYSQGFPSFPVLQTQSWRKVFQFTDVNSWLSDQAADFFKKRFLKLSSKILKTAMKRVGFLTADTLHAGDPAFRQIGKAFS